MKKLGFNDWKILRIDVLVGSCDGDIDVLLIWFMFMINKEI